MTNPGPASSSSATPAPPVPSTTFANLPAAANNVFGLYVVTDRNNTLYFSNGSSWSAINPNSVAQSQTVMVMMGDSVTGGGTYQITGGTIIGNGRVAQANFTNHQLQPGNPVFITGCAQQAFNGTFTGVNVIDANNFTYLANSTLPATATPDSPNGVIAAIQSTNPLYVTDRHYVEIANAQIGHPIAKIINAGGSGQGSTSMLSRFTTDVLANNPSIIFLSSCAINDIAGNVPLSIIQSNISAMVQLALSTGAQVLLATITPKNTLTTAQMMTKFALNRWIRALCQSTKGLLLVDFESVVIDYTSTTASWLSGYSFDGLHPNATGTASMAVLLQSVLQQIFPQTIKYLDVYSIEDNVTLNAASTQLYSNPLMTGTAGTVLGTTTGTAPTNWIITNSSGPTTVALAGVARTDGVGLDFQWTLSGTTAGTVTILGTDITGNITAGQTLQMSLNLQGTGMANITSVQVYLEIIIGGTTYEIVPMSPNGNGGTLNSFNWVLKTGVTNVPPGTITNYRPHIAVVCGANPTGVFKLGACSIRAGV